MSHCTAYFFVVKCGLIIFGGLMISYIKVFSVDPIYLIAGQKISCLILQFNMPDLIAPQPHKIVIKYL